MQLGTADALERVGAHLMERLGAANALTVGLCHGDLNSTNVHFTDLSATVFDFDCCHWGWVANDLAGFARGITLGKPPGEDVLALMNAFLEGYRSVRPVAPSDRDALHTFLLAQRIWMASLHVEGAHRWGAYHFGAAYAKRLVDWLSAWENADLRRAWVS
jgi:Ser/Thr protein kinase RdoA (MazF antagonist)